MAFLQIPYQFKNGIEIRDCGTENLAIDNSNFSFCGKKYFTLRIISISNGVTTFEYNGDTYGVSSLSTEDVITLLASAFTCTNSYCNGQQSSFDYTLTALSGDKWESDSIVNSVSPTNVVYSFADITVAGITYGTLPHQFWDDAIDGNASSNTYDYIQAIIDYIVSLNIPEYIGAVNFGVNDASDNSEGTGLLHLYFTTGTTVSITITAPSPVISGTFNGGTLTTYMLKLLLENTSIQAPGDVLVSTNYQISDGSEIINNSTTPDATVIIYNIFCNACGTDPEKSLVLNLIIVTQNACVRNNVATGFILAADIQDCILHKISKTGSSVG